MKTIQEINHWEEMKNVVIHCDCLELMKKIPVAKFIITGAPVIKKNSREIHRMGNGRPFLGKSTKLKNAECSAVIELKSQKNAQKLKMITAPIHAKFSFFLPTRRLPDLSNLYQLGEDAMEKAEIIENDKLICSHDGSRRFYSPKNPRTEIEIFPFDGELIEAEK